MLTVPTLMTAAVLEKDEGQILTFQQELGNNNYADALRAAYLLYQTGDKAKAINLAFRYIERTQRSTISSASAIRLPRAASGVPAAPGARSLMDRPPMDAAKSRWPRVWSTRLVIAPRAAMRMRQAALERTLPDAVAASGNTAPGPGRTAAAIVADLLAPHVALIELSEDLASPAHLRNRLHT